ncbi:FMN-binding protein MioC [Flocculibacter collagenilyticus]|uniref:FMN-binding protein MioC n=1 Tax=Flocculibacter collagenilyticus TaxID=2744479 RepID=UPI0018F3A9FF|nr:FMN-binding protein MioC [Flocculibacter collagenilyticus]
MKHIEIIIGSQMGGAEYTAEQMEQKLTAKGWSVNLHETPQLDAMSTKNVIWLVCTSTHGAGDLPDNIQPFYDELDAQSPDLSELEYSVLCIGDSSYDTYCGAGTTMDQKLAELGAKQITEMAAIDVMEHPLPEEFALEWLDSWIKKASQ